MMTFTANQETLATLLQGARTRILDIVDAQKDFMEVDGALAVNPKYGCKEDASKIIAPMNTFFAAVPKGAFDLALLKFDTHFADEYAKSPESKLFPNPHCIFGTDGWNLAVDIAPLVAKIPTYMLAKNVFDMWGSNPTGVSRDTIRFMGREEAAYDNLFKVIDLQPGDVPATRFADAWNGIPRDDLLKHRVNKDTLVVLCGVASDFCNYQAALGYLQRGATVVIAEDLTAGIGGEASPAPETGSTREMVAAVLKANPDYARRLYIACSADVLESLQAPVMVPGKPVHRVNRVGGLTR